MSARGASASEQRAEAERLLASGESARAELLLQAVVESRPDDPRAWHLLGTARYRNGRVSEGAEAFRRRLQLVRDDAVAHYSLAIALRDLGQLDEARAELRRAIQLKPDFAQARQRLAQLEQAPAAPDPPSPDPAPVAAPGMIVGQASRIQQRVEPDAWVRGQLVKWTFRVERMDELGKSLPPVPVEMRGLRIDGALAEGDWVEIPGRWKQGSTLRATKIRNLTTYETIRVRRGHRWVQRALILLFVVAFLAFAGWVISSAIEDGNGGASVRGGTANVSGSGGELDPTRNVDRRSRPGSEARGRAGRVGCSPTSEEGVDLSATAGGELQWVATGPSRFADSSTLSYLPRMTG